MRIPTSLIVMSIATAIPFGLAIRDTVKGTPHRLTADEKAEAAMRAEQAEQVAREAAASELEAKEAQATIARIPTMFGATPASLGSALHGYELGTPVTKALQDQWDDRDNLVSVYPEWDDNGTTAVSIAVALYDVKDSCDQLRAKLVEAWGAPTDSTWLAKDGSQRATLDGCKLEFERALAPTAWLAAVDVYGQSEAKVAETRVTGIDETEISWDELGLGYGTRVSTVTAVSNNGKVVYVTASADTDFDTLVAVRDAISARMKTQPVVDDETGDWVWKKAPSTRLHREPDSNDFTLAIGKEP